MTLKVKVCGMLNAYNVTELVKLNPDYIGFIFYPGSKRFIGPVVPKEIMNSIPGSTRKTGVFVDEPILSLIENFRINNLDLVQLHGNELPEYCENLQRLGIPVIKAFSISPHFDFQSIGIYEQFCEYFLFDTASILRGGSGLKFDWEILSDYHGNTPFFLSGGIQPGDSAKIISLNHPKLIAVDLNSGFEVEPGIKDISRLKTFIEDLRSIDAI